MKEQFIWYMEYNTNAIKDVLDRIEPIIVKLRETGPVTLDGAERYRLREALREIEVLNNMGWNDIQIERRYQDAEKPLWKRLLRK